MMDVMDTEEAVHLVVVGVVAVGAVVFLLAAAASGACGCAAAFPAARWRKRAQVGDDDDDVESALGGATTVTTYEQAAAASSSSPAAGAAAEGADTCAICCQEYSGADKVRRVVRCSHFFHAGCVDGWLREKRNCPLCRAVLSSLPPLPNPGCRRGRAAPPCPPPLPPPLSSANYLSGFCRSHFVLDY
ncbi:Os03g0648600 [Oryza sativa Japonica Group]|uniref:Os03g0648600 protein n=2 Tax=Oryza sativa subsp. japonica TaxID=39947 RepID=A0A0P0W0Q7_ORYSJ|nr:probable E3 ubiquitin-protein ligase ATL44 [Oryza sativa Japonica Group]KAB8092803.1 hypothetical protein EE612_019272 [Oryza sativa]KAF2940446.1 hypothetical protein DAI22_03g272500 [Oryza sativa Japonica Group]BAS85496.1 Os03g0648600 [Oryza sativa Japonica Group]